MSFAVLYIRIQPNHILNVLNKILIAFLVCQAIEETLVVILKCKPIEASYKVDVVGECLDLRVLWWSTVRPRIDLQIRLASLTVLQFIFNLFTDLFLFIQPIPAMWKLQLPAAKRVGLVCMLSLGLLLVSNSLLGSNFLTLRQGMRYFCDPHRVRDADRAR